MISNHYGRPLRPSVELGAADHDPRYRAALVRVLVRASVIRAMPIHWCWRAGLVVLGESTALARPAAARRRHRTARQLRRGPAIFQERAGLSACHAARPDARKASRRRPKGR